MKDNAFLKKLLIVIFFAFLFAGMFSKLLELLPDCAFRRAALNGFEISLGVGEPVRNRDGTVAKYIPRDPVTVDLGFMLFKFGFAWRFNAISLVGFFLAYYLFIRYRH